MIQPWIIVQQLIAANYLSWGADQEYLYDVKKIKDPKWNFSNIIAPLGFNQKNKTPSSYLVRKDVAKTPQWFAFFVSSKLKEEVRRGRTNQSCNGGSFGHASIYRKRKKIKESFLTLKVCSIMVVNRHNYCVLLSHDLQLFH